MKLQEIISILEFWAPIAYQESYDNSGLLVGNSDVEVTKALITLDCIEAVVEEAIQLNCNLIIAHHPIIFSGLKRLTGKNYVERTILKAIKNDIAIYAIHTNLDNIYTGVNAMMAEKLKLKDTRILSPKQELLRKLVTYVPRADFEKLSRSIFDAGAGHIGNYSDCGFSSTGIGSFMGNENSQPAIGKPKQLEKLEEVKFETIFPAHLENKIIHTLKANHPYEEVAYDIYSLENVHTQVGSGMIGELAQEMDYMEFLNRVKSIFQLHSIRYSSLPKNIQKIALCGGSGSFLRYEAKASGADVFISSDFKYHEWFDAESKIGYIDIGHYESERFTLELISKYLKKNAVSLQSEISKVNTNPVNYL